MTATLDELKGAWLGHFPDSTHPTDLKNFIRYALELARTDGALDFAEMERAGITPPRILEYQRQYEFLRYVLDVLGEETTPPSPFDMP